MSNEFTDLDLNHNTMSSPHDVSSPRDVSTPHDVSTPCNTPSSSCDVSTPRDVSTSFSSITCNNYEFNAQINKLLKIIIHHFYSSKDVFLRELISNASDALDKAKYYSFNNGISYNPGIIKIKSDKINNLLIIEDNGIGMTKEDVIQCLGTIAKSGTEEFIIKAMQNKNENVDLIGQFGIGFYSAFLVADKVQFITKHLSEKENKIVIWESIINDKTADTNAGYSIIETPNTFDDFNNGSKIILHINKNDEDYLNTDKISEIIKKHSSYISYPIMMLKKIPISSVTKSDNVEPESLVEGEDEEDDIDEIIMEENNDKTEKEKSNDTNVENTCVSDNEDSISSINSPCHTDKLKKSFVDDEKLDDDKKLDDEKLDDEKLDEESQKIKEFKEEYVQINSMPLWTKNSNDITLEEYESFYKNLTNDFDTYQVVKHFKTEGEVEFKSILFIPKHAPFNMFDNKQPKKNIKLYVKKVLITEDCIDIFPEYFNFISGIVECDDLPLNASRELLQNGNVIKKIRKILIKKVLQMFSEIKEDEEKYNIFYNNFSKNIKLAIHEDSSNKTELLSYLIFPTNKSNNKLISLDTYVKNMKENQQGIYYISGNSIENIKNSVFIEKLVNKEFEVLFMCDPLDEYIMQQITEYNKHKFINVCKDELKIEDSKEQDTESTTELCTKLKNLLGDNVSRVVISSKLESHPSVVVNPMGWSANMERIIKAQALSNSQIPTYMINYKTLEINPSHPIIKKFEKNNNDEKLASIIYNIGLLAGGYELTDTNLFLSSIYNYIEL